MLDDSDIAFHNLFGNIICGLIVFHRIKLRFSTDLMDCTVEQITLGRRDFTDCPVIITDIFLCGKLTVLIRHILVHKGFAFIDTVNCSGKGSVALRCSFLTVTLCYGHGKLFKNVREVSCGYFFPVNRCGLICRHNITDCGIHFLNGVWGSAADKHIIKRSNTVFVCYGMINEYGSWPPSRHSLSAHNIRLPPASFPNLGSRPSLLVRLSIFAMYPLPHMRRIPPICQGAAGCLP